MIEKINAILFPPANKPTPLPFISDGDMANNERNQVYIVQRQLDNNQELFEKISYLVERLERHETRNSTRWIFGVLNMAAIAFVFSILGFTFATHPPANLNDNNQKEAIQCEK